MVGDTGAPAQDGFDGHAHLLACENSDCDCSGNLHYIFEYVELLSVACVQHGFLDVPSVLSFDDVEIPGSDLWADYNRGRFELRRSFPGHYTGLHRHCDVRHWAALLFVYFV